MPVYKSLTREIDEGPSGPQIGAFFDLDRTILAGFSAFAFLAKWVASGRASPAGLLQTALASARFELGQIGFSGLVAETAAMLAGYPEKEYASFAQSVFEGWLAATIYPESRALVRAHQRRGHTLAVVSSATRYQVEPVARALGIEHVLCTELEVVDGRLTGRVIHPTCYREGKLRAAEALAARERIEMDLSYFYTDSDDDLTLLDRVGRPRPVNPNRRLAAIAAKRGWWARAFTSRGPPRLEDIVRTGLSVASLGPALLLGAPIGLFERDWRRALNLALTTWGELGTTLAGINLRVVGEEHLWSARPAVFIFNHQSAIDVLLLCKLLRRDFIGLGKQEILRYPLLGRAFRMAGTIFVDRFDRRRAGEAARPAVEALREGLSIAIAPEGTRSATPRLGTFKRGAFRIAMEAGVPIVPIVFLNALDALPKHGVIIRGATIEVVVHPPIRTDAWQPETLDARITAVRQLYRDTLEQSG